MQRRVTLALCFLLLGLGFLSAGQRAAAELGDPGLSLASAAAASSVFLACLALCAASLSRAPGAARLGLRRGRLRPLQVTLLALGLLGFSAALHGSLVLLELEEGSALVEIEAGVSGQRGAALLLLVLALGIAPALGEELFFRGALQRGLLARMGALPAIGLTAAAFGVVHLEPVHAAAAFGLGLYLGCVAWLADGVRAAMICHAVNNSIGVIVPALRPDSSLSDGIVVPAGFALGAAALAGVGWWVGRPPGRGIPARDAPLG